MRTVTQYIPTIKRCTRCQVVLDHVEAMAGTWCVVCAELNSRQGPPPVRRPALPEDLRFGG